MGGGDVLASAAAGKNQYSAAAAAAAVWIGFTFLVPAHPGSPGKRAVKRVCVCVCVTRRLAQVGVYNGRKTVCVVFFRDKLVEDCLQTGTAALPAQSKI